MNTTKLPTILTVWFIAMTATTTGAWHLFGIGGGLLALGICLWTTLLLRKL